MSKVWTPMRKPPDPSSICSLSYDAQLVLAALREAHAQRIEVQHKPYQQVQAKDGRSYYQQLYRQSFKTEEIDDGNNGGQHKQNQTPKFQMARQFPLLLQSNEGVSNLSSTPQSSQRTTSENPVSSPVVVGSEISRDAGSQSLASLVHYSNEETETCYMPWQSNNTPVSQATKRPGSRLPLGSTNLCGTNSAPCAAVSLPISCFRVNPKSSTSTSVPSILDNNYNVCYDVSDGADGNGYVDLLDARWKVVGSREKAEIVIFGDGQPSSAVFPAQPCWSLQKETRAWLSESDVNKTPDHVRELPSLNPVSVPLTQSSHENLLSAHQNTPGTKPDKIRAPLPSSSVNVKQASNTAVRADMGGGSVSGKKQLAERYDFSSTSSIDSITATKRKLIPIFSSKPAGQKHKVKKKMQGGSEVTLEQFVGCSSSKERKADYSCEPIKNTWKSVADYSPCEIEALEEKISDAEHILLTLLYTDGSSQLRERGNLLHKRRGASNVHVEGEASSILVEMQTARKTRMQQSHVTFPLGNSSKLDDPDYMRKTLLMILESTARKVCFDAQELMHTIILSYKLDPQIGCSKWEILDPKVACWLLDPDNPPVTFSQVLEGHLAGRHALSPHGKDIGSIHGADLQMLKPVMEDLCDKLKQKDLWELFINVEVRLIPVLAGMEAQGVKVNAETLQTYGHILKEHISEVEKRCFKAAGHPFQINSHVQLRQILFDDLKLDEQCPGQKFARTNVQNLKSTSETVLQKLKDVHPLPELVLNYRQFVKLNSTYIDGLKDCVSGGYIHTCWEQTLAASGRLQSSNPNIQNIPKQPIVLQDIGKKAKEFGGSEAETVKTLWMREPFVSHDGWTFIAADFQSIELRILAHLSQDPVLLKIFNDRGGTDIFVQLTCEWLGMKLEDVKTQDREQTKRIVYSVVYGVGPERLAETLNVSKENAKSFTKSFIGKFKGIQSFTHHCIFECQRHGAVRTIFNRHRLIANINSQNFQVRAHAERQAVNFVVQGSAADICKIAMIQSMSELSERSNLRARLLVQIHDELLFEVHDEDFDEVKELLKNVMETTSWFCGKAFQLKVPLPVSFSVGRSWGHLKPV